MSALEEAFNVDKVTRDFFREYKKLYDDALELVSGVDGEERKQFVQTLFNRLMFVYFLSRKGWLRYEGETDYLNALWNAYAEHPDHDSFYRDRLTFLFFEGLNNPDSRDLRGGVDFLIGDVPFLNGGLFEESELDRLDGVHVPDDAIRPLMTELFDKFNFTVMESTPFDIEVAVDPEMLGKVFEELVTGRHDSGAYYTPRPVVSFMCREALVGYLSSHAPQVGEDALRRLVEDDDASQIPRAAAPAIGAALDRVTVVDPACGSGAYLVGMMQELPGPKPVLGLSRLPAHTPWVVIAEGLFDWLVLAAWGLPAVAALGTQGMDKLASSLHGQPRVLLAFDADDAGREATQQLSALLGLHRARVVTMPSGVGDVAELGARPDGRSIFLDSLQNAAPLAR